MVYKPLKVDYRKSPPWIVSYNYTDIADGTGVQQFQGYKQYELTLSGAGLTKQTPYSQEVYTKATTTSTAFEKMIDLDFDLTTFQIEQAIKGTARVNVSVCAGKYNTAAIEGQFYVIAKIRNWDGTTETEIASGQTETKQLGSIDGIGYVDYWLHNMEIPIATKASFSKGDTLRITIELWGKRTEAGGIIGCILHDPKNRLNTENIETGVKSGIPLGLNTSSVGYAPLSSQIIFDIPFEVDN